MFAAAIGPATVPADFAARAVLKILLVKVNAALLNGVIVIGGPGFLWRALTG